MKVWQGGLAHRNRNEPFGELRESGICAIGGMAAEVEVAAACDARSGGDATSRGKSPLAVRGATYKQWVAIVGAETRAIRVIV